MTGMMDLSKLLNEDVELEASIEQELKDIEVGEIEEPTIAETVAKNEATKPVVEKEVEVSETETPTVVETMVKKETVAPKVTTTKTEVPKEKPKEKPKETAKPKAKADKDFVDTIGIQMPSDDKYLKNLQSYTWIEDPIDGEIKIYRIDKDSTYEKRTKYRYLAPEMIEGIVGEVLSFTELGGSFVYTTVSETGVVFTINETITGYYPAVMSVTKGNESVNIKIKHTAKYITGLVGLISDMIDNKLDENETLHNIFKEYIES